MRVIGWDEFVSPDAPGIAPLAASWALPWVRPLAVTIGVFDGVHRGHQALLERVIRHGSGAAVQAGATVPRAETTVPTVITFLHNPKRLLSPGSYEGDILSLRQKLLIFEEMGIELVILIDFSASFCKISGEDFIRRLHSRSALAFAAVGDNFRCGWRLDTGAAEIKALLAGDGVPVEALPPVLEGGERVSSSRVRRAIRSGDFSQATALLGRPFVLDLADIPAESGGGFFRYDPASRFRVCPGDGRYRVLVYKKLGEKYGKNPCPERQGEVSVEKGKIFVPPAFRAEGLEFL